MSELRDQPSINGDLSIPVVMRTSNMQWQASPSQSVWRKRLHLVGDAESGQVTSLVKFEPNSSFPIHDHPDGEEILVLEGVFSDEQGDWGAGSYLLNPEGYRHQPYSLEGCLLFVKLRQYQGRGRNHVTLRRNDLDWQPSPYSGVMVKHLYHETAYPESTQLECWQPGMETIDRTYPDGIEYFVLEGSFSDHKKIYCKGDWIRLPAETRHSVQTKEGCTLYVKLNALSQLKPG